MVFIEPRSGNNRGFCLKEDSRRHVHNLVARLQEIYIKNLKRNEETEISLTGPISKEIIFHQAFFNN